MPTRTTAPMPQMPMPAMPAMPRMAPIPPMPRRAAGPLSRARRLTSDPRHYQILVLASLLVYGLLRLNLEVRAGQALAMGAAALLTQLGCTRLARHAPRDARDARDARDEGPPPRFDPRSACISVLSLCLLLRTDRLWLAVTAAVLAIAGKFFLRVGDKHLWNPTNFGLVVTMTASRGQVWVSPGQWGSAALFGFLVLCLGGLVVNRAARSDVTYAFLIFTFFMISDPKTTPDSRAGRILFACLVALGAGWAQFALYRPTGLLLSLACLAPLVPLLDRLLPGTTYRWPRPALLSPPTGIPCHEYRCQ